MTSVLRDYAPSAFSTARYAVTHVANANAALYNYAAANYNVSMVPISESTDASFSAVQALRIASTTLALGDILVGTGHSVVFTSTANTAAFGSDSFVKMYLMRDPARSAYLRVPSTAGAATGIQGLVKVA